MEELDWSVESLVLIPAEHFWCFWTLNADIEPRIHHQTAMTCTVMGHPSLAEKKALPICGNKDGNIIHVLKNCICNSFEVYEMTVPICTSHWCLVMNF